MELRHLHLLPVLRFPLLRHRQRLDFLLQHRHDDALDRDHFGVDLRLARGVLAVLGAVGLDEARGLGALEGETAF